MDDSGKSSLWTTYPAQPHALPFRTILGEYRARRPEDLADATLQNILKPELAPEDNPSETLIKLLHAARSSEELAGTAARQILEAEHKAGDLAIPVAKYILKSALSPQDLETVWTRLDEDITKSEQAYRDLAAAKERLQRQRQTPTESRSNFKQRLVEAYEQVLVAERVCQIRDHPLKSILYAMKGSAVCLSGGGIRSASFSLGILQGLARFSRRKPCGEKRGPLLDSLDYLSTVSGGGYIGSWLMAWAARSDYHQVVEQLASASPTSGDPEPGPVRHLREYTSYLSPRYGFTLDTFTLLSIVMRNMALNWLILVPLVMALLCLPQFLYDFSYGWAFAHAKSVEWFWAVMGAAVGFVLLASITATWRMVRPPYTSGVDDPEQEGSILVEVWLFALPVMVSAWLLGEAAAWADISGVFTGDRWSVPRLAEWLMSYTVIPPLAMSLVRLRLLRQSNGKQRPTPFHKQDGSGRLEWGRLIWSFLAPVLVAALTAGLMAVCTLKVASQLIRVDPRHLVIGHKFVVLVIPLVLAVMMAASTLLTALLAGIEQEEEREWWARAGGLLFSCVLVWLVLNSTAFFAAGWLHKMNAVILGAVGLGAGYVGSAAGLSAATTSGLKRVKTEQLTKFEAFLSNHGMIAPVASGIALLCVTLAVASLTSWLRVKLFERFLAVVKLSEPSVWQHYLIQYLGLTVQVAKSGARSFTTVDQLKLDSLATLAVFGTVCLVALFANLFVNINIFSLHGMYRMRLTRSYLGASNFARHPDAFTNFDRTDNMYEADVPCQDAPLHVINTALNLVATKNMAWQQRKAEPFSFTPLSVGSWRLGYLPTREFGGGKGVTLGTALAISGAAFNPNMGYHSSPLVTLLMTFFNARLGWWLPNPMWPHLRKWPAGSKTDRFLGRSSPKWALMPLLNEALGNTDDTYKWIVLSDGGHFENLGLYEMVLRRCRHIIVVDADADSEFHFEDLGNAIRKIEIDLGVPITFPGFPHGLPMKSGVEAQNLYCIRGVIQYNCVDDGAPEGELMFIKPSLNGSEPPDVRAYAASHQTFPHEATSNQFFNESQFESYRHLGSWMISTYFENTSETMPSALAGCDMAAFFARVESLRSAGQGMTETAMNTTEPPVRITLPAGEV